MKTLHIIAFTLLVIGGLNWLLFAFDLDISAWFGGMNSAVSRTIYILFGIAAIFEVLVHKNCCKECCGVPNGSPSGLVS